LSQCIDKAGALAQAPHYCLNCNHELNKLINLWQNKVIKSITT
jgi:hypothetical protein